MECFFSKAYLIEKKYEYESYIPEYCKNADVDYVNYFKDNSVCACTINKIAFILVGLFLAAYLIIEITGCCKMPTQILEYVLIALLAILLVKKGFDLKLK